jgi:hypothetical protein
MVKPYISKSASVLLLIVRFILSNTKFKLLI